MWLAEIARLFVPWPPLAAFSAGCLAAFVLLALTRASRHILGLWLLVTGVSAAIAWMLGSLKPLADGFAKAQIFGAFLPSVLMLRATAEASPRIERLRSDLSRFDHAAAQNWLQYGAHGLGAVLNVGATAVLGPAVSRGVEGVRREDLARAATRGVGSAAFWSPFYLSVAFSSQLVPGIPMWQAIAIGLGLTLIAPPLTYAFFTPALGARGFRDSVAGLRPLVGPMALVVSLVIAASVVLGWSGLQAVAGVVPVMCLAYLATLGGAVARPALRRTAANFARLSDELLIVVGATMLGAAIASIPAVRELGASVTPEMISGPALLAVMVVVLLVLGQLGLHPMIGSSIVVPVMATGGFGLATLVIYGAAVFSWGLNAMVSIWTIPAAAAASIFEIPAQRLVNWRSIAFAAAYAAAGLTVLGIVNALLT